MTARVTYQIERRNPRGYYPDRWEREGGEFPDQADAVAQLARLRDPQANWLGHLFRLTSVTREVIIDPVESDISGN